MKWEHKLVRVVNVKYFNILKSAIRGKGWRSVRKTHIIAQPWCQCCGTNKNLEVHHFKPWHLYESLRLDPNNLVTLCRHCHFRFGHFSYWKDYNPNLETELTKFEYTTYETRSRRKYK